jgi:hypothetical protein
VNKSLLEAFNGYEVQRIDCCLTCGNSDNIEGVIICTCYHEEVSPLGKCDLFERGM